MQVPSNQGQAVVVVLAQDLIQSDEDFTMTKKNKARRWFSRLKGANFIQADKESVDVFVHYSVEDSSAYSGVYDEQPSRRSRRSKRRK